MITCNIKQCLDTVSLSVVGLLSESLPRLFSPCTCTEFPLASQLICNKRLHIGGCWMFSSMFIARTTPSTS